MTKPKLDPEMIEAINTINKIIEWAIKEDRLATLRQLSRIREDESRAGQRLLIDLAEHLQKFWHLRDTKIEVINDDDAVKVSGEPVPIVPMIDVGTIERVEPEDWVR